jgi:protein-S-isoprenylcysteine O-methyltransferase Ste14
MKIFNLIILIFWLVFLVYWLVSAIGAKRSVHDSSWWRGAVFRLILIAIVFLLLRNPLFEQLLENVGNYETGSSRIVISSIGIFFCAIGIALAIWARVYIGRNWGMPMSLREEHELVTTGPYAFVRHPIYTGILLAALGSLLVSAILWLVPFVLFCAYFVYSAKTEEKQMVKQFPKEYPEYRKRVKALIPFIW